MTTVQIQSTSKMVFSLLQELKLKAAFNHGATLIDELQEGVFSDRFFAIQQDYNYLLEYFAKGIEDPLRKNIFNKIVAQSVTLFSEVTEELLYRNSTNFEYLQKRYYIHKLHFSTTDKLFDALNYHHQNRADVTIDKEQNKHFEKLYADIFSIFWLKTSFQATDFVFFKKLFNTGYPGKTEQSLAVSALTFNLWRMFDEAKLHLLIDCCQHENAEVKQRSLVGLCFILAKFNWLITYFPSIRNRLVLLADDQHISLNFQHIVLQIISTIETEKISKKLREELLPEIIKASPLLKEGLEEKNLLSSEDWEEANPEWHDMLEKSGLKEKLEALTELHLEGADVYMGTFAMLKNYGFFNEFSNWFLPFDTSHSNVNDLFSGSENSFLESFIKNPVLCNSDKYSFCLSIMQMPENQRNSMKYAFKAESDQMEEMTKDQQLLTPEIFDKNISKSYVQDLYRFFKLHPSGAEFTSYFDYSLGLHKTSLFDFFSSGNSLKSIVAEFYFAKSQYNEAIELFDEIIHDETPTAAVFQKMGYCFQQLSNIDAALAAYHKADLLQPDHLWTTKKLAFCYKISGNYNQALQYYQHADFIKPQQLNILFHISSCFVALKNYENALDVLDKIERIDVENLKAKRVIIWLSLLTGNVQKAAFYSETVLETSTLSTDFLHATYISMLENKISKALTNLQKAYQLAPNGTFDNLTKQINDEIKDLREAGVVINQLHLLLDAFAGTIN